MMDVHKQGPPASAETKTTAPSDGLADHSNEHTLPTPEDLSLPTRTSAPATLYGELSILGYNGSNPSSQRSGRRHKSKFMLCQRSSPNGIKKSKHYIVKDEPQATKAMQDKDTHSISYTFSRSQTIIVEYKSDENTDMFQIGRSTEEPIDFVLDTVTPHPQTSQHHHHNYNGPSASSSRHQPRHLAGHHHHHMGDRQNPANENVQSSSSGRHQGSAGAHDMMNMSRIQRNLAKVGFELVDHLRFAEMGVGPPPAHGQPVGRVSHYGRVQAAPMMYNFQQPPHMPHMIPEHQQHLYPSLYHTNNAQQMAVPQPAHVNDPAAQSYLLTHGNMNKPMSSRYVDTSSSRNNRHSSGDITTKRSHSTNSTISRFACRILVDRRPPYTARIYAAGFDSSKNIFLGEKAPKWEKDNSIDGLTTNGILLRHPIREINQPELAMKTGENEKTPDGDQLPSRDQTASDNSSTCGDLDLKKHSNGIESMQTTPIDCESGNGDEFQNQRSKAWSRQGADNDSSVNDPTRSMNQTASSVSKDLNDSNLISEKPDHVRRVANNIGIDKQQHTKTNGGVWREVSVDGGIYAIRQSRSAPQIGNRIMDESNILQDGTLIDLCGATLLWRSVEGLKSAPTKMCLEEKLDKLNATRPQCPVGLNTLVIPKKPVLTNYKSSNQHHQQRETHHHHPQSHPQQQHHHHHHHHHHQQQQQQQQQLQQQLQQYASNNNSDNKTSSHQPYVYFKCGHVQGHHDWGTTEGSNLRTCPICLSVGTIAKLSMGLEPSFYVQLGPLTHAFNPCGHMTTEPTVRYWSSVKIPYGTHFFQSICPFCATPLAQRNRTATMEAPSPATNEEPFTRLIFQDELD